MMAFYQLWYDSLSLCCVAGRERVEYEYFQNTSNIRGGGGERGEGEGEERVRERE